MNKSYFFGLLAIGFSSVCYPAVIDICRTPSGLRTASVSLDQKSFVFELLGGESHWDYEQMAELANFAGAPAAHTDILGLTLRLSSKRVAEDVDKSCRVRPLKKLNLVMCLTGEGGGDYSSELEFRFRDGTSKKATGSFTWFSLERQTTETAWSPASLGAPEVDAVAKLHWTDYAKPSFPTKKFSARFMEVHCN